MLILFPPDTEAQAIDMRKPTAMGRLMVLGVGTHPFLELWAGA